MQKFRSDYSEFRTQFEKLKADALEQVCLSLTSERSFLTFLHLQKKQQQSTSQRAELISSSATSSVTSDTRRRFQTTPAQSTLHPGLRPSNQSDTISESPFRSTSPYSNYGRESRALDEHSFVHNTDSKLDEFLAQGREVLDNLVDQRKMLKGTHKRLLDAANTLGLSRQVIGWIERRRCVFVITSVKPALELVPQYSRHVYLSWRSRFHIFLFLPHMALFRLMWCRCIYFRLTVFAVGTLNTNIA